MSEKTIAGRIERLPWTSFHTRLLILLAVGEFFDLYDLFAGGFVVVPVAHYFGVSVSYSIFYTIAVSFLGAFIGCLIFTVIGDAMGRRTALLLNLAVMSIAYLVTPFAQNILEFGLLRFVAGLGYGPEAILVLDIMTTEFFPAKIRGRGLSVGYTMAWVAPLVVSGIAYFTSGITRPLMGWQILFIIGGLGILALIPFRFLIPESPRWLEVKGRNSEAEAILKKMEEVAEREKGPLPPPLEVEVVRSKRVPISTLFKGDYRKRTVMLWIFELFQTGVYYGFTSLAPTVLYEKGFSFAHSLEMSIVIYTGYFFGSITSIFVIDSTTFDRKWQIAFVAFLMGVDGVAFGYSNSIPVLVTTGFLFGTLANVFSNAFHLYGAELYPTRIRSFADGVQYSISRLGNFVWLSVLPTVLAVYGPLAMFTVVFLFSVIILLDIGLLGPRSSKTTVEDLSM